MDTADSQPVRSALSLVDEVGTVFFTPDRVLRGIHPSSAGLVEALLASGLPAELAGRGLMPAVARSERQLPGYAFVLETSRLPVITYPGEWSYGMLRDAALLVLEVNRLANTFGYELKDCHPFNVLFDGPRPCYVDLGSLVPRIAGARGWIAREDFIRTYEYPLQMWADGGAFLARHSIASGDSMSHADHGLYRWPWLRWAGIKAYQKVVTQWHRYRRLSYSPDESLRHKLPGFLAAVGCQLKNRGLLPWQDAGLEGLRRRTLRRKYRGPGGLWSSYQGQGRTSIQSPRFRRIMELIRESGATSSLELAGNQGLFSEELLRAGVVSRATCTDADERAVEAAYERTRSEGGALHVAVLDIIYSIMSPFDDPPVARLRSDAVIALAVTHHLLLTQGVPVEQVLRRIAAFAGRFVFIEFMPLGLWDGKDAVSVPAWYNLEWFRAAFAREFELWHEELLEPNRVVFCGRLRARQPSGESSRPSES
jgi:hypothetical protein